MGSFINFLNENYAPLYHFTMIYRMQKIVNSDFLGGNVSSMSLPTYLTKFGKHVNDKKERAVEGLPVRISFTRNKKFNTRTALGTDAGVRIEFDKDKLASKYKFEKYVSDSYEPEVHGNARQRAREEGYFAAYCKGEAEERILFKNKLSDGYEESPFIDKYYNTNGDVKDDRVGIANLHKFINRIDILGPDKTCYDILHLSDNEIDMNAIDELSEIVYNICKNDNSREFLDALSDIAKYCAQYNIELHMLKFYELLYKVHEKCHTIVWRRSEDAKKQQVKAEVTKIVKSLTNVNEASETSEDDNIICENYAPLYHFTGIDGLKGIIKTGTLNSTVSPSANKHRLCFTRDKFGIPQFDGYAFFVLEFDKNLMSNAFKIEPYSHSWIKGSEHEERITGKVKPKYAKLFSIFKKYNDCMEKPKFCVSDWEKETDDLHNAFNDEAKRVGYDEENGDSMTNKILINLDKYLISISIAPFYVKKLKAAYDHTVELAKNGEKMSKNFEFYKNMLNSHIKELNDGLELLYNSKYADLVDVSNLKKLKGLIQIQSSRELKLSLL